MTSLVFTDPSQHRDDPDAVRHHDKAMEGFSPSEGPGPHNGAVWVVILGVQEAPHFTGSDLRP